MTRAVWLLVLTSTMVAGCGGGVTPVPQAPSGARNALAVAGKPDPRKLFATLDVNGNKVLSFAEFFQMPCPPVPDDGEFWTVDHKHWLMERYFAHMDTARSDGALARSEFEAGLADDRVLRHALFDTYDEDRNRVLDFGEALASPEWGTPLGGWLPGQKEMYVQGAIAAMDQDGDGLLNFDEFRR